MVRQAHYAGTSVSLLVCLAIAGCGGPELSGVYLPETPTPGGMIQQIEFTSATTAEMTSLGGIVNELTYTVEGDRVRLTGGGQTMVWTMEANCLHGGEVIGEFCKR